MAGHYDTFLALHQGPEPLLIPNPWDAGSAKVLVSLGYRALATTSGGFAASLGKPDGTVTRDEALEHARVVSAAVDVPVSADLENCFADDPDGVAATVRAAAATGLAGCSVEDYDRAGGVLYDKGAAVERVAAAVEAASAGPQRLVLTARAENHIRGNDDLADTVSRLQAYQEAGADVLYAPGLLTADAIRTVVSEVDRPVNVLALPGVPPVDELGRLGVRRISVGSTFAYAALSGLVKAAQELLEDGTYGFLDDARPGARAGRAAFRTP